MVSTQSPLVIFDLDGTLLHSMNPGQRGRADGARLRASGPPDFKTADGRWVWLRPGVHECLAAVAASGCRLAVWTAAPADYAALMVTGLQSVTRGLLGAEFVDVLTADDTTVEWRGTPITTKDLRGAAGRRGWPLHMCLVVDDTPSTYAKNPMHALPVPTWSPGRRDSKSDDCLPALAEFLVGLARQAVEGGAALDVRGWRHANGRARGALQPEVVHTLAAAAAAAAGGAVDIC